MLNAASDVMIRVGVSLDDIASSKETALTRYRDTSPRRKTPGARNRMGVAIGFRCNLLCRLLRKQFNER